MVDTPKISTKRLLIVKSNARTVLIISAAAFIAVSCLVSSKYVYGLNTYQAKVISAKQKAHDQLTKNLSAVTGLMKSYNTFVNTPQNAIGGNPDGSGDNDGDNAKIVLDALPSTYDFPALTSSLEKILGSVNAKGTITGTDDQVNQQTNTATGDPKSVIIPFMISVSGVNYDTVQQLINKMQTSIRPMAIDNINLTGGATNMSMTINAHTYYQPGKNLTIKKEVVK